MNDHEQDELFARARGAAGPTDADRRRVRAALTRRLGVAVGATVGATTAKAAASVAAAGAASSAVASGTVASGTGASGTGAASAGLSGLAMVKAGVVIALAVGVGLAAGPLRRAALPQGGAAGAPSALAAPSPVAVSPSPLALRREPSPGAPPPSVDLREAPGAPPTEAPPPALSRVAESADRVRIASAANAAPRPAPAAPAVVTSAAPLTDPPSVPGAVRQAAAVATGGEAPEAVALMTEIQLALRSGDNARALSLVREHERRFPESAWLPEREGARVLALCATAGPGDARRLGQTFVQTYPLSPLGARVRAACGVAGESR